MNKKDVIICRCEDVTLQEIHDLLEKGYTDFEEIKRILRIGMGPCQGNTCGQLVQREISKYLNVKLEDVKTQKVRPLTTGVKLNMIKEGAKDES
ncbi:MAG TPA: (2Fe-2S)-binding protein [Haloplasmataceae bacterium]